MSACCCHCSCAGSQRNLNVSLAMQWIDWSFRPKMTMPWSKAVNIAAGCKKDLWLHDLMVQQQHYTCFSAWEASMSMWLYFLSFAMLKAGNYCRFARRSQVLLKTQRRLWQSSREATKALGRCRQPAALIRIVKSSHSKNLIDGVFCAAALHRLSLLSRQNLGDGELATAWKLCYGEAMQHLESFGAQELAVAALAMAKARPPMSKDLLEQLLGRVLPGLHLNSTALPIRYCANLLWATAAIRHEHLLTRALFQEVEVACHQPWRHGRCNARDFSQVCWAFASSGRHMGGLRVIESSAQHQGTILESYSDHDVATTIWAVATMSCPGPQGSGFLERLMEAACEKDFAPQGLSMTFWGLATLAPSIRRATVEQLLAALVPKVLQHAGNLAPQGASNILWAVATLEAQQASLKLSIAVWQSTPGGMKSWV